MKETRSKPPNERLTEREAAAIVGVHMVTLATWRKQGTGPAYMKLGEKKNSPVRYERDDLEAWLQARKVVPKGVAS